MTQRIKRQDLIDVVLDYRNGRLGRPSLKKTTTPGGAAIAKEISCVCDEDVESSDFLIVRGVDSPNDSCFRSDEEWRKFYDAATTEGFVFRVGKIANDSSNYENRILVQARASAKANEVFISEVVKSDGLFVPSFPVPFPVDVERYGDDASLEEGSLNVESFEKVFFNGEVIRKPSEEELKDGCFIYRIGGSAPACLVANDEEESTASQSDQGFSEYKYWGPVLQNASSICIKDVEKSERIPWLTVQNTFNNPPFNPYLVEKIKTGRGLVAYFGEDFEAELDWAGMTVCSVDKPNVNVVSMSVKEIRVEGPYLHANLTVVDGVEFSSSATVSFDSALFLHSSFIGGNGVAVSFPSFSTPCCQIEWTGFPAFASIPSALSSSEWSDNQPINIKGLRFCSSYFHLTPCGNDWYELEVIPSSLVGEKGEKGDKGDAGEQGPQGEKGDSGEQGAQGPTGPQGEKGDKGDDGEQGPQGPTGAQGEKGDKGDSGEQGAIGPQGPTGPQGEKGDKGDSGEQGPQGEKGDKGDAGEQGPAGPAGTAGTAGQDGQDGQDADWSTLRIGDAIKKPVLRNAVVTGVTDDLPLVSSLGTPTKMSAITDLGTPTTGTFVDALTLTQKEVVVGVSLSISDSATPGAIAVVVSIACSDGSLVETIKYLSLTTTKETVNVVENSTTANALTALGTTTTSEFISDYPLPTIATLEKSRVPIDGELANAVGLPENHSDCEQVGTFVSGIVAEETSNA